MEISEKSVLDAGACNFCNRGIISKDIPGLVFYAYDKVVEINGKCLVVVICKRCLSEIKNFKV